MNLTLALVLSLLTSIHEVKIDDPLLIRALVASSDSLRAENSHVKINFHLVARVEDAGERKIVYVSSVLFLSSFKFGLPDNYSMLDEQIVFWYKSKVKQDSEELFNEFRNQFHNKLVDNLKPDGSFDRFDPKYFDYYAFEGDTYRFVIRKNNIESVRRVCNFPNRSFFQRGLTFDDNGDLMYSDGAYDICNLDNLKYPDYSISGYLESKGLSREPNDNLSALITIGKDGKVTKVSFIDPNGILTEELEGRYRNAILSMPEWVPAMVKGKKVCYRVTHAL